METNKKILIAENDQAARESLRDLLKREGFSSIVVDTASSAIQYVITDDDACPDLLLLDITFSNVSNIVLTISKLDKTIPIIIMSKDAPRQEILNFFKMGAFDHLAKPLNNEDLLLRLNRAFDKADLKNEGTLLKKMQTDKVKIPRMIGISPHLENVIKMIDKIAKSNAKTILVMGDSGTGKELVAKLIHYQSRRANMPFVAVNCAAIPDTLLETELMGYEKGAYTDARKEKKGLFELANGGTLLLDEIGEMNLSTQAKILRVLEERSFRRVGGLVDIEVDVRIIAATNAKLKERIKEKTFREDLYYRLLVVPIYLPPLRERREDISVLIEYFIHLYNREFNKNVKGVSKQAKKILENYSWPGNIRELKNVIERALILENSTQILPEHLPYELIMKGDNGVEVKEEFVLSPAGISLEEVEKSLVKQALLAAGGKQVAAAKLLGLSRDAFRRRMKKFDFKS